MLKNIWITLFQFYKENDSTNFTNHRHKGLNPHTPVAQKVADEVVFRRFQGEGVEFF